MATMACLTRPVPQTGCATCNSVTPCTARGAQPLGSRGSSMAGGAYRPFAAAAPRRNWAGATAARQSPRLVTPMAALGSQGTVAVSGATGLIGSRLVQQLLSQGYAVRVLTRNPAAARSKLPFAGVEFAAPPQWPAAVRGTVAVINLAGEPIATRWTPEIKAEVKRSRVAVTSALAAAINAVPAGERPVFISASAVGFYGSSEGATFNEQSASGRDYLAEVCREWEAAANKADTRVVILRTGIVLAKEGGALGKMIPVFQIFAGGPLGSGRQWMSWIHRDDVVRLILEAVRNPDWRGVYNATAPNPVRMGEMCSALGSVMGRPSFVPVPDFALKTLLGEGAQVVLEGQRVLPRRAQEAGFRFRYTSVGDALRSILR